MRYSHIARPCKLAAKKPRVLMKIKIRMLMTLSAVLANAFSGMASAAAPAIPAMHVSVADEEFNGPFASWGNVRKSDTWGDVTTKQAGARGDGIADDTDALQAAFDSMALRAINNDNWNIYKAGSPAVMYVPTGIYRITRTLRMTNKMGVELVGEDPANTRIVWDGPEGGTMMILDGVQQSRYSRISWEGSWKGSPKAGIGIAHWYNTTEIPGRRLIYGGSIQHVDEVFKDMGVGIAAGCCHPTNPVPPGAGPAYQYGQLDSEGSIRRTRFINNSVAGVSVESANALNWWVWDSEFIDCERGLTNFRNMGNFMAYRNLFRGSKVADIHIGNTGWFSMHNNVSIDSKRFFQSDDAGRNSARVVIQNNRILDTIDPVSIYNGSLGPLLLIDNQIRSRANVVGPVVQQGNSNDGRDIISIGNRFTIAQIADTINMVDATDRLLSLQDRVVERSTISSAAPAAVAAAPNGRRAVFEVPVTLNPRTLVNEATAATIQKVINAAAASEWINPIVHLPAGTYSLSEPLVLPARRRMQLMGEGMSTRIESLSHLPRKPFLLLRGPSYATVRDMYMEGRTSTAVVVENADQVGGRIFFNGVTGSVLNVSEIASTRIEGQANSKFDKINATAAGSVLMMGSGGVGPVSIRSGSNVVMNDTWYEGQKTDLFRGDSGNFTYLGGAMAPGDPVHGGGDLEPAVGLEGFAGQFTMAAARLNVQNASNGIFIGTEKPETKVLILGVQGEQPGYFQRTSSGGDVRLSMSKLRVVAPVVVSQVGDDGKTGSDSLLAGLAQTRSLIWDTVPYQAPAGATDVRFYRVKNIDTALGFDIIKGTLPVSTP